MQSATLPSKITQCVDKLCCNFIWGTTEHNKKNYTQLAGRKSPRPKKIGGLGLQSTKERNIVLLAKLNWQFHQEKDSLWTHVLAHKYKYRKKKANLLKPRSCSTTWATLKKGEPIFMKGTKWIASMNSGLSFWHDKWLNDGSLRNLIIGPF